jgi:hypothetical protein
MPLFDRNIGPEGIEGGIPNEIKTQKRKENQEDLPNV